MNLEGGTQRDFSKISVSFKVFFLEKLFLETRFIITCIHHRSHTTHDITLGGDQALRCLLRFLLFLLLLHKKTLF